MMYTYYNNGRFSFPPNFDFNIIPGKDSPATVISVIGDSDLFSVINKMEIFEDITSSSMKPMNIIPPFRNDFSTEQTSSYLSGYYCESQKIVFIHLRTLNDSDLLLNTYKSMKNEKIKENFFDIEDSVYLKFVLYLFLLSDFILISIIGLNIDPFYVTLFSQVNILRKKYKSITENELKTISNSLEVTNNGRLVQPRLLFVLNPPVSPITAALKQKPISIENLREKIEEKLYAVLKYHNICGSEYSLAKLQTNSPFVFIRLPMSTQSGRWGTFGDLFTHFVDSGCQYGSIIEPDREEQSRAFQKFITDQIYTFSVTKESSGFGSENISCRNWFKACHKLYNLFCSDKCRFNETVSSHRYSWFKKGCELALVIAESHYKDGLPSQYSRDLHSDRAKAARQILLSLAKGPTLLSSVKILEDNLNKVWAVGRQICEAISVTRQRCKHEVHLLPMSSDEDDENELEDVNKGDFEELINNDSNGIDRDGCWGGSSNLGGNKLPRMKHCSEVQLVSACNCGRRQSTRHDPFDYKEANWEFYKGMNDLCCFRFPQVKLPESNADIPVVSPALLGRANDRLELMEEALSDVSEREMSQSLLPRSRRIPDTSISSGGGEEENYDDDDDDVDENHTQDEENEDEGTDDIEAILRDRRGSGDNSRLKPAPGSSHLADVVDTCGPGTAVTLSNRKSIFSGMFTTSSDRRSMPRFSSWNLLDSGPYFSYTHSSGLEYSGFVHGSNYLLPWDVPLKTRINKVRKQRVKRSFAAGNFVKAFLGFEMECPVGHRFFLAGPDNMMAGSMASQQVKEAVSGLLTRDIPLYFPCQCSTYLAQLMRIYVAVPNSNLLRIFLQPRVRPGPVEETPIFTPGSDCPVELEPGHLWVLRLPFAYEHEGHVYRQQAEMRIVEQCKLLKESIFYEEVLDFDDS